MPNRYDITKNVPAGAVMEPVFNCTSKEEAISILLDMVEYIIARGEREGEPVTFEEALQRAKNNIGYFGSYDSDHFKKIRELFEVNHPYFGETITVTPVNALEEGYRLGRKLLKDGIETYEPRVQPKELPFSFMDWAGNDD